MLGHWLGGFLTGGIIGLSTPIWRPPADLTLLLPLCAGVLALAGVRRPRWKPVTTISIWILAAAWSFSWTTPSPRSAISSAVLIAGSAPATSAGMRMARSSEGWFSCQGTAAPGAVGKLVCHPRRSVFATHFARFVSAFTPPGTRPIPTLEQVAARAHNALESRLAQHSRRHAWWLRAVLFGSRSDLPAAVEESFKRTGIFHLLIVSGTHVTWLALILGFVMTLPWQIAYTVRWLDARRWQQISSAVRVMTAVAAMVYAGITGLSQASQRAALVFGTAEVARVFTGTPRIITRLLIAATLQTLIYPIGFFTEGNLLSWAAYLSIVDFALAPPERLARRLARMIYIQLQMTFLLAGCIGQLATVGILVNLVVVPIFPVIMFCAVTLFCVGRDTGRISTLLWWIQESFLKIVDTVNEVTRSCPWASVDLTVHHPGWQGLCLVVACVMLLGSLRRLVSRSRGDSRCESASVAVR